MISTAELIVLGLLAERPWTAYELTNHVMGGRNFGGAFWPVSERTWYRVPLRLVGTGLATAQNPDDGNPTRYEISDAGRAELAKARPMDEQFLSFRSQRLAELYATATGPIEGSIDQLEQIRDHLVAFTQVGARSYRERAEEGPDLPGRAHIAALLGRYMSESAINAYRWADEAIRALRELDDSERADFARTIWSELATELEQFLDEIGHNGGDAAPLNR